MDFRSIAAAGVLLLAGCSGGSGSGGEEAGQRCADASACPASAPVCDGGVCAPCTGDEQCTERRPVCAAGACYGVECAGDAECDEEKPLCSMGICTAPPPPPPGLLVVLDRSGTMGRCVEGLAGGGSCDADGDGTAEAAGVSRWELVRAALTAGPLQGAGGYGLVVANAGGGDPLCGEAAVEVEPGSGWQAFVDAWRGPILAAPPSGGTPIAAALTSALGALGGGGETRVVLITDGEPNCDPNHPMPCVCANEPGCPDDKGEMASPGIHGWFRDARFCLDQDDAVAAVEALRDVGFRTAVVAVGIEADARGALGAMARAGGLEAAGGDGAHRAATRTALIEAIEAILAAE